MTSIAYQHAPVHPDLVRAKINQLIATLAVGLGVFLSGFVMFEPAPHEVYMAGIIGFSFLAGLRLSRITVIPLFFFVVIIIGGLISVTQMPKQSDGHIYMAITFFLGLTAVFYAAIIENNHKLLKTIFIAYVCAALGSGLLGIGGFLGVIPGGEIFTLYDRAKGAFKDPNVFGPFLVLPALYLIHCILTGSIRNLIICTPPLLVIILALFLAFSRAAWGLMVISTVLLVFALFIQTDSVKMRFKLTLLMVIAFMSIFLALLIALQVPQIQELLAVRFQVVQEYDGARVGRFARHAIGFGMAMENPLGIGPLEFGKIFGEDTHAMWLKAFMAYSWLGFAGYFIFFFWTGAAAFRILFRPRPWQPYLLCAFIVFFGHMFVGIVIDLDKWRHLHLIYGIIWGCIALEAKYKTSLAHGRPAYHQV